MLWILPSAFPNYALLGLMPSKSPIYRRLCRLSLISPELALDYIQFDCLMQMLSRNDVRLSQEKIVLRSTHGMLRHRKTTLQHSTMRSLHDEDYAVAVARKSFRQRQMYPLLVLHLQTCVDLQWNRHGTDKHAEMQSQWQGGVFRQRQRYLLLDIALANMC